MKTALIYVVIVASLFFSLTAHANWFFVALRGLSSMGGKALDITHKVVSITGSLDAMRDRRVNSSFATNHLRYENGKISFDDQLFPPNSQDREIANELRKDAWKKAALGAHLSAKRLYEQSLSIDTNNSNTWHGYGWTLSELGKYNSATNAFTTAIYINNYSGNTKHEAETWRHLGWNYQRQGYFGEAELSYKEALAINPNNRQARIGLKSITNISTPDIAGSKKYRVIAQSGLRLRASPSTRSNIIKLLPYESSVSLLRYTGKRINIAGAIGRWAQVSYQDRIGYVFGAHLEKIEQNRNLGQQNTYSITSTTVGRPQRTDNNYHYHGKRSHSHPIPNIGIQHKHNNGVEGSQRANTAPAPAPALYVVQAGAFTTHQNAKRYS